MNRNIWDAKLLGPFPPGLSLLERVHALFAQQRASWDLFRENEAALDAVRIKTFSHDRARVVIQANPGRSVSTNANVDPAAVAVRPCFLCPGALPPAERGIAFGDYVMLPNPFPVLRHHMTIACRDHVSQKLDGRVHDLFAFAKELGPGMFLIYNGPRCGASAPDHFHFQACCSEGVPLLGETHTGLTEGIEPRSLFGRTMLACRFRASDRAEDAIGRIIAALRRITGETAEPMLNLVVQYRDDRFTACLFPRTKHRSTHYFAPTPGRIAISPAAIEMAGVVVVADTAHFERVDEAMVLSMFREVTFDDERLLRVAAEVA